MHSLALLASLLAYSYPLCSYSQHPKEEEENAQEKKYLQEQQESKNNGENPNILPR